MLRFERELITEWRRLDLPAEAAIVLLAVSGGADSMSLLIAADELKKAKKLDLRLVAAHFNHGLRGEESDADEAFVREICSERKIELAVGHARSKPTSNVEQAARIERYEFLTRTAENLKASIVLTAHTIDDQAETFLLNLIRGSGLDGLSGMRPARNLSNGDDNLKLVRPLLRWAHRAHTEAYCHEIGIDFRSDTMNEDESFTRVRVRKILLPLLRDFNPKIVERLAETARLLCHEIGPAQEVAAEALKLADLKELSEPELGKLLRSWLAVNRGNLRQIELKHIDALRRLIHSRRSGKTVELPGGSNVVKHAGQLVFKKNNIEKEPPDN
jgi:tRNA(Ile)-lysidine synthase